MFSKKYTLRNFNKCTYKFLNELCKEDYIKAKTLLDKLNSDYADRYVAMMIDLGYISDITYFKAWIDGQPHLNPANVKVTHTGLMFMNDRIQRRNNYFIIPFKFVITVLVTALFTHYSPMIVEYLFISK